MSKVNITSPGHLNKSPGNSDSAKGKVVGLLTSKLFAAIMAFTVASLVSLEAGAATFCLIGLNTDDGGDGGTLLGGDGDGEGGGGDGTAGDSGGGDGETTPWTDGMPDEVKAFFGESKSLEDFQSSMPKSAEVPESYEVPEGIEIDQDQFDAFVPIAKEGNFSQEQVALLLKYDAERAAALPEQMYEATQAIMAEGLKEMKASLGEDGFNEATAGAKLYVKNLPDDLRAEAVKFFDETGMGNHPTLIKILAGHAKFFKEDSFTGGNGGEEEKTPAQRMYPNQGKS